LDFTFFLLSEMGKCSVKTVEPMAQETDAARLAIGTSFLPTDQIVLHKTSEVCRPAFRKRNQTETASKAIRQSTFETSEVWQFELRKALFVFVITARASKQLPGRGLAGIMKAEKALVLSTCFMPGKGKGIHEGERTASCAATGG
jgi:hypothetical protein